MTSRKHKKVSTTLNYIEIFLILASKITGYTSISVSASFLGIPIGITSSAIRLKICAITAGIKKFKSIIKEKKKHDGTVFLEKSKLNSTEVLISKVSIVSVISHDEFVLINNVLKEYNEMKEDVKNLKTYSSLLKVLVYLQNNVIMLFQV